MSLKLLSIAALVCMAAASCTSKGTPAVPKPEAYARVAEYDSVYVKADSIAVNFETNAGAVTTKAGENWLNIAYPAYDATVYVTFTPTSPDSISNVINNRRQRMDLNISDRNNLQITELQSNGFTSMIMESEESQSIPLQFLSTDGKKWVVSGAVFFSKVGAGTPVDSIRPMIEVVRRDLMHALQTISSK